MKLPEDKDIYHKIECFKKCRLVQPNKKLYYHEERKSQHKIHHVVTSIVNVYIQINETKSYKLTLSVLSTGLTSRVNNPDVEERLTYLPRICLSPACAHM